MAGMADAHELGRWGEAVATDHLVAAGWRVLARNYRDGPRELDLIVTRAGVVAFVEVKTRVGAGALDSIGWRKRVDLARAAARWIRESEPRGGPGRTCYRFDVVVVRPRSGRTPSIETLEDAWRPGF